MSIKEIKITIAMLTIWWGSVGVFGCVFIGAPW